MVRMNSEMPGKPASDRGGSSSQEESKRTTSAPGLLNFAFDVKKIAHYLDLRVSDIAAVGTNPAHSSGLSNEVCKTSKPGKGPGIG